MNSTNLFEIATKEKFRYNFKGVITTENLWELSVEDLNTVYQQLSDDYSKMSRATLIKTTKFNKEKTNIRMKIAIVEYIVNAKMEEAMGAANAILKKAEKEKILAAIADKENSEFASKSKEELLDMLNKLDN